nr:MAG TPA: hypothetical protein [Caudoviricetes sp.]
MLILVYFNICYYKRTLILSFCLRMFKIESTRILT